MMNLIPTTRMSVKTTKKRQKKAKKWQTALNSRHKLRIREIEKLLNAKL